MRAFFTQRLHEFLRTYQIAEDIIANWRAKVYKLSFSIYCSYSCNVLEISIFLNLPLLQIVINSRGPARGVIDVCYVSSKRRNHFTRVSVAMALNLIPNTRLKNMMPRHILALVAQETRERFLVGEMLLLCPYPLDEISSLSWDGTNVKVELKEVTADDGLRYELRREYNWQPNGTAPAGDSGVVTAPTSASDDSYCPYFTYGNTVILDWGQIVTSGHFHNRTQIFPLGFRCIRQEIDIKLNRLVDCLCEIDFTIQVSWCLLDLLCILSFVCTALIIVWIWGFVTCFYFIWHIFYDLFCVILDY